jgi:hypothetical protein
MTKTELKNNQVNLPDGYPDVGDNVHDNVIGWLSENCGENKQWFIPGECVNGHRIAKRIVCGKEWCPICSKMGSMAHNRRYVRWLPKIMRFKSMRYLVFTIPESLRGGYRTKKELTVMGRRCQEMLKRHGFNRGLRRWHWFGDKSHKWHPHLNVLIDGSYLNEKQLRSIKSGWARILGTHKENVRVTYKTTPADMAGCLHYVTRSTFIDYNYDIEMAQKLRGFRNMVVWGKGKWDDAPVWELNAVDRKSVDGEQLDVAAIENIVNHSCPKCGSHITWGTALPGRLLDLSDKESYGAGYYLIIERARPPDLSDDIERRLARLRMEYVARCMWSETEIKRVKRDSRTRQDFLAGRPLRR